MTVEEMSLPEFVEAVVRRKWTILVVTAVTLIVTTSVALLIPRTYEGKTSLIFPESSIGLGSLAERGIGFVIPGVYPTPSGRNVYYTVLKSRTLSENVCKRLHLDEYGLDWEDLRENITIELPKEGGLFLICGVPTSWLQGRVPKSVLKQRTAELAAEIANAYIAELKAFDRANNLFLSKKHRVFIEEQIQRVRGNLAIAEARLQKFQEAHPTLLPPDADNAYAEQALQIATKQTETDVALEGVRSEIARARESWVARAPEGISPEAVIGSPVISALRANLAELEVRRATLLENFKEEYPDVVGISQQIEKTKAEIAQEVDRIIHGRAESTTPAHQELLKQIVLQEITRDGLEARRAALAKAYSAVETELVSLPAESIEYSRLLRDLKATETVYATLLGELAKAQITEGREAEGFIVLDVAKPPKRAAKPNRPLIMAMGLVLGVVLGTFAALAKESLELGGRE